MTGSKPIFRSHALPWFLCRFALIFGLLILPWQGWNDLYAHYFRDVGQLAFSREGEKRLVCFDSHPSPDGPATMTTRMSLGNTDLMGQDGKGLGEVIDLDTRSIGWVPTALTIALILASPVRWPRRMWALGWGLLLVHAFILFSLQTWIWSEEPALSLTTLSPWAARVVDELQYTLITQLGASFSVPVLIWLLVTFRREDLAQIKR